MKLLPFVVAAILQGAVADGGGRLLRSKVVGARERHSKRNDFSLNTKGGKKEGTNDRPNNTKKALQSNTKKNQGQHNKQGRIEGGKKDDTEITNYYNEYYYDGDKQMDEPQLDVQPRSSFNTRGTKKEGTARVGSITHTQGAKKTVQTKKDTNKRQHNKHGKIEGGHNKQGKIEGRKKDDTTLSGYYYGGNDYYYYGDEQMDEPQLDAQQRSGSHTKEAKKQATHAKKIKKVGQTKKTNQGKHNKGGKKVDTVINGYYYGGSEGYYYLGNDEQLDEPQLDKQPGSEGGKKPISAAERYPNHFKKNNGAKKGTKKGNEETVHINFTMDLDNEDLVDDANPENNDEDPKKRRKRPRRKRGDKTKGESKIVGKTDKKEMKTGEGVNIKTEEIADGSSNQPKKMKTEKRADSHKKKANKDDAEVEMALDNIEMNVTIDIDGSSDFRFNKVGVEHENMPLKYPMSMSDAGWLRSSSQAVSVIVPDDCGEDCSLEGRPEAALSSHGAGVLVYLDNLIRWIGGPPSHYGGNESIFWDELREVITVREQRLAGVAPETVMPIPELWSGWNLHEIAAAVHNEFPGSHHVLLLEELMLGEQRVTVNRTVIPSQEHDFVRGAVMLSGLTGFAIRAIAGLNFGIKWFVGRARPEEVVWDIILKQQQQGVLNSTSSAMNDVQENNTKQILIPSDIYQSIMNMSIQSPEEFTAYPEGSPMHPSWPAMHAAASAASVWVPLVLNDMPMSQICEIRKLDYAVSYARTVAGVHYPSDNIAGLKLGQEILRNRLPEYLADTYGADPYVVRDRLEEQRFEWDDFMESECNTMANR